MPINPDRPDVTNSPPAGRPRACVQIESGVDAERGRMRRHHDFGSPVVTTRIGVRDWLEAQVGSDGLRDRNGAWASARPAATATAGAKVRLLRRFGQLSTRAILRGESAGRQTGVRPLDRLRD